jgi:ABC-2 type transport system ATP-binding protein
MGHPIQAKQVHKNYDQQTVLNNVSLSLNSGEIFGLIGLNGVGKTTLIKIILQLTSADSGEVFIFDKNATDVSSRRNLAYLPEKFQPSRYLRGMEYLDLALSYYGKKLDKELARKTAEDLDLPGSKLDNKISSYSKGMGQKIGLVGAILADTPLLILDEPMSGLDPLARIKLKQKLKECKAQGKTVFFSSHILADLDEICDRVGIIHGGEMRFTGTPAEFKKQHPAETLELSFLGAIAA